jgi:hypothetical protein
MRKLLGLLAVVALATVANAQFEMTDTIAGSFTDISGTGNPLYMSDDDSQTIGSTITNDLVPAGLSVNSNGTAGLGYFSDYYDVGLPSYDFYGGGFGLAPFWDDLNPSSGGMVYWQEADGVLTIQWDGVPHYYQTGDTTFQIKVFESGPVLAQFIYEDMYFGDSSYDYGADATVGFQVNYATGDYVQWSYHSAVITDGLVLSIIPEPASLALLALGGLALIRRR